MATQLEVLTGETPPDPDAQATVTDFLDYTEYLPSDLVRSLTLIGKLDDSYLNSADQVHLLTKTYGSLPNAPPTERPNAQALRQQISHHLDRAINTRESAYAEASRLYDAVDRHSSRLTSIISKLNALPKPPSRDPTPVPQTRSPQTTRGRTAIKGTEGTARLTLNGPRPINNAAASAQRSRQRSRKITVPGEVLPPPNPDSPPPITDSEWESAPPSPLPMPTSRVGASSRNRPTAPVRIRPPKLPKQPKQKTPRLPRGPGMVGTNVHSAVAGISTSNALSLLSPPPADAKPGSEHAPWMRLTEYEMAKLRKRMKKNAIWSPSETMIRRELAESGRGPENYRSAKSKSEATGEPFVDDDHLASRTPGQPLQPGEISADALAFEETLLSNRGMKLNEAKKMKREALLKEQEEEAKQLTKLEVEQAAKRLGAVGGIIKNLYSIGANFVNPNYSAASPPQAKALEKAKEKEREREKEREKEKEKEKEREREKERLRIKDEKAREKERERQREIEAREEMEKAKVLEREEQEKQKRRQAEFEQQQLLERQRLEQERLEEQRREQERVEKEIQEKKEQEAKARAEAEKAREEEEKARVEKKRAREEEEKAREVEEKAKEAEREAAAKSSRKRKREPPLQIEVPLPEHIDATPDSKSSPKKRRTGQTETLTNTITTTVPLAAPGPSPVAISSSAPQITPASETRRSTRRPSLTLRAPAAPAHPAEPIEPSPRSATRASTRNASVGRGAASIPSESRRRSATPAHPGANAGTAASQRSRRSAPGPVIDDPEGGAAVSVGIRKTAPKKRATAADRAKAKGTEKQIEEEVVDEDIDPDEERYCVCGDVSWGGMVKCDNNEVSILTMPSLRNEAFAPFYVDQWLMQQQCEGGEWFHYSCVGLTEAPPRRKKWWCPTCRKKLGKE
ncbi:MAG: hypothetical protein Q9221_007634 [Calogaya cf. arnoldii]